MYKSIKELFTAIADELRERLDIEGKIPTQDMPQRVQDLYFTSFNNGRDTGESIGYTRGYSEGEIKGREQGLTEGKEQGKTEAYGEIQDLNAELEQTLYGTDTGGKSYYDEFWDRYQKNGNRYDYEGAFAGDGWNEKTLKPKYDVATSGSMTQAFWANKNPLDLVEVFKAADKTLDTSQAFQFSAMFSYCGFTRIGTIDFSNSYIYAYSIFNSATNLKTIDKLVIPDKAFTFNSWFVECYALENLTIEGVISNDGFNVQWSTKLSKASIISIINALSTTASEKSVTLSKVAVESAFGSTASEEWISLINTRSNWTINLV